ncbi:MULTISPECIES: DUF5050 domain-containing protein [Sorangium]|uniref:ZU5 domain-containing protein n=1 Tax=Sorangium cellulosum TaxID=56 RepID=A0A4P2QIC1_SORCE|nr:MULTISPECIES: DUF5050 domain-containing protein [Sorangium]AUX29321.1 hypothetical protein SOCE836_014090 [Sorangium cellulosum]WCQ88712.1 hypothetical protein NQZ70_01392 [Sorangium sp. Soce836]
MTRTLLVVLACAAAALSSASCGGTDKDDRGADGSETGGGDTSGTGAQPGSGQFSVDAQGGTFTAEDGFTIEVPSGAVSEETVITVERVEDAPEGAVGPMYVLGPEGQTFDKPITLTLPITIALKAELGEDTVLGAYGFTAQEGSNDFAPLARHDVSKESVVTETDRLSSVYPGMPLPTAMASQHRYPNALAADGSFLYFASGGTEDVATGDNNDGFIYRVKPGTAAAEAMIPADPDPKSLWVNDSHVYWASGGDDDPVIPSAIRRVDKASQEVETLVEVGYVVSVIGDASALYFGDGFGEKIYTMPLDGGEPVVLAEGAGNPEHLAQDAENIYWTGGAATNKVYKVAKSGGEVTVIAENEAEPAGIAVDAEFVYWANVGDGGVFKAPIAGGQKTLVHQGVSMAGLALRGSTLFSTDTGGNRSVNAHDLESDRTVVLALGQPVAWRVLAPEGQGVFWSNAGDYRYQGQVVSYHAP